METPSLTFLKQSFRRAVAERLSEQGFQSTRHYIFRRPEAGVTQLAWAGPAIRPIDKTVGVLPSVSVRHERVEALVSSWRRNVPDRTKKWVSTVGATLGMVEGKQLLMWVVNTNRDIEPVADEVVDHIREFGIPYLNRFSDLGEVEEAMSRDESIAGVIIGERVLRQFAIHILLHGTDDIQHIANEHYRRAEAEGSAYAKLFIELVDHLKREAIIDVDSGALASRSCD